MSDKEKIYQEELAQAQRFYSQFKSDYAGMISRSPSEAFDILGAEIEALNDNIDTYLLGLIVSDIHNRENPSAEPLDISPLAADLAKGGDGDLNRLRQEIAAEVALEQDRMSAGQFMHSFQCESAEDFRRAAIKPGALWDDPRIAITNGMRVSLKVYAEESNTRAEELERFTDDFASRLQAAAMKRNARRERDDIGR